MNKKEKKAIEDMNRFANGVDMSCVTARQMQIILNLIEKLQKENETLKNFVSGIVNENIEKDFIPIQKVKDKIEELKSNPLKIKQNDKYYYETHAYNKIIISVLQELIEAKEVE